MDTMRFPPAPGLLLLLALTAAAQTPTQSSSSKHTTSKPIKPDLDPGSITNRVYQNKMLGLTFKIPDAWVLRTDDLNARNEEQEEKEPTKATPPPASSAGSRVLLAAFSRPPEAKGEDINASILIAVEPQSAYPGLQDALQYLDPITEVAKAQGFTQDEDPYEIAVGNKTLVRADFHKDIASRVMRQSTLAMLAHSYAVSITVIAGTEDDVEELIDNLSFTAPAK